MSDHESSAGLVIGAANRARSVLADFRVEHGDAIRRAARDGEGETLINALLAELALRVANETLVEAKARGFYVGHEPGTVQLAIGDVTVELKVRRQTPDA